MLYQLGMRPVSGVISFGQWFQFTLTIANVGYGWSGLAQNLAANLGQTPVLAFQGVLNLQTWPNPTDPNAGDFVPLAQPFVFQGPNLVIDVQLQPGQETNPGRYWIDQVHMRNANATHFPLLSGTSCGGSLQASLTGTSYQLSLTSAGANQPVMFLLGIDNTRFGTVPLPIPLAPLGMTGCTLGVAPVLFPQAVSDAQGTATLTLPFDPATGAITVFAQGLHPTTNNAAGLATSQVVHSALGQTGLFRSVHLVNGDAVPGGSLQGGDEPSSRSPSIRRS